MASPGNQHCANCIGTLSVPIAPLISTENACFLRLSVQACERRGRHELDFYILFVYFLFICFIYF